MNVGEFKEFFVSHYYQPAYLRWRINNEKAGKDIVGEQYEIMRKQFYEKCGLTTIEDRKSKRIAGYDADTMIETKSGIILEEDKAHYVDSCFLQRAISSHAKVIFHYLNEGKKPPLFILSCPTKMNNFEQVFNSSIRLYRDDIKHYLETSFHYLPLCQHGRVSKNKYFSSSQCSFDLDDKLIGNQLNMIENIISSN